MLVGRAGPGDEGEGLLVVEDGAQPDLVVHDGLEALDGLQLHPLPLAVPHAAMGKWSLIGIFGGFTLSNNANTFNFVLKL